MLYRQITFEERYTVGLLRQQGLSAAAIARTLGRHRSTIGREVRRNRARSDGTYRPQLRTALLEAIRAEEARVAALARRATAKALQLSERGRILRAEAGKAGWLGRRVRLWMAHRLEAKAARILGALIATRRLAKAEEGPAPSGHRAARRRLDRENG